jgi:hypothetical protein
MKNRKKKRKRRKYMIFFTIEKKLEKEGISGGDFNFYIYTN